MNRLRLTSICLGLAWCGIAGSANSSTPSSSHPVSSNLDPRVTSLMPPSASTSSPVALFRNLLSMSPADRARFLAKRPPQVQAGLRAKISEYLAMDPDARELRLRATELRWQLVPLLRMAPSDRGPRLAQVPPDLAPLVTNRLAEWDQLPPALQQEFLANDRTLHYFSMVATTNQTPADSEDEAERERLAGQFNQFFELTPDEKQKTLKTLSPAEQIQMATALQAFGRLTPPQRFQCLHAFAKFAELSPSDRAEFLKNAARWSEMSPKERQTWRDLVSRVPTWPPLPPMPLPMPPPRSTMATGLHPAMATNH